MYYTVSGKPWLYSGGSVRQFSTQAAKIHLHSTGEATCRKKMRENLLQEIVKSHQHRQHEQLSSADEHCPGVYGHVGWAVLIPQGNYDF